ncbi:MBL fold metallo-hydrolase [Candidatus Dojkabacteria bacterium]|nr:MBL fold metallo-hydrolase [Candidatus Dojkabacteria bacterium]
MTFISLDQEFHLYFLDVGQGDSILISTSNYQNILIDGGESEEVLVELGEVMPFWDKKIDVVIGTHADSDHIGGLSFVLENYDVDVFITSDLEIRDDNLDRIKDIGYEMGIEMKEFIAGDSIDIDGVHLDCLWPEEPFEAENDNQNSVVLRGYYGDFSFLLTGDIESEQESEIVSSNSDINSLVLKAAHHGSKTATSDDFLTAVNPDYIIISCGYDNKFGHPAEEIIDKISSYNIEILRTDRNGRIEFTVGNGAIYMELEKR